MFSGSIVLFRARKRKNVCFFTRREIIRFYRSVFFFEHLRTAFLLPHATSSTSHPTNPKTSPSYLPVEAVVLRERVSCLCVQPLLLVRWQHGPGARRPEGPRNKKKTKKKVRCCVQRIAAQDISAHEALPFVLPVA